MKKSLRLIAFAGAMGLVAWLAPGKNAEAYPYPLCSTVQGTPCGAWQVGATGYCWLRFSGTVGQCRCDTLVHVGEPSPSWQCSSEFEEV